MSATLQTFLAAVDEINGEKPSYRLGGKATDGTCDCIGLIIGALLRCGVKWPGIHGSNWAAWLGTLETRISYHRIKKEVK